MSICTGGCRSPVALRPHRILPLTGVIVSTVHLIVVLIIYWGIIKINILGLWLMGLNAKQSCLSFVIDIRLRARGNHLSFISLSGKAIYLIGLCDHESACAIIQISLSGNCRRSVNPLGILSVSMRTTCCCLSHIAGTLQANLGVSNSHYFLDCWILYVATFSINKLVMQRVIGDRIWMKSPMNSLLPWHKGLYALEILMRLA